MKRGGISFLCALVVAVSLPWPSPVLAVPCPSGLLPPNCGMYLALEHATYMVAGIDVSLLEISHFGFTDVTRTALGPDQIENFSSILTSLVSLNGGPPVPAVFTGPVQIRVFGLAADPDGLGTFNTEMLAMNLQGNLSGIGSVFIREDPTRSSAGVTSIAALGGGLFDITSFFDVFTQISLDGVNFISQIDGPSTVILVATPEPPTLLLLGFGLIALAAVARRRLSKKV